MRERVGLGKGVSTLQHCVDSERKPQPAVKTSATGLFLVLQNFLLPFHLHLSSDFSSSWAQGACKYLNFLLDSTAE